MYFTPEHSVSSEALYHLTSTLAHRGPDDQGFFQAGNIALGHRRLSIIDPVKGHQPVFNEDRTVVVLLNGAIYNFQPLRQELTDRGHSFSTYSDTEVLVHGYEEWGIEGMLSRCNGMFALCLYDCRRELLYLVRDRLGKKPLYYAKQNDLFLFSSEIRGFITGGWVSKEISPASLNLYVKLHYPSGEESLIKGIKRILPGHYLTIDWRHSNISDVEYWKPHVRAEGPSSFGDWCERIRFLLRDAVRLRAIADVPVGTFLSGGLDSSLVTGLLREWIQPLNTFSIGFNETGFDESSQSSEVVRHFQTSHHRFILTAHIFADFLQTIMRTVDEPVADAACIPTYWLAQEARKTVKVILAGEGSDELFAGYDYYQDLSTRPLSFLDRLRWSWNTTRGCREFLNNNQRPIFALSHLPLAVSEELQSRLISPAHYDPHSLTRWYCIILKSISLKKATRQDLAQMADIRCWLVDDVLMKLDKMSMLNSLEIRAPFLDYRLVECALATPASFRIAQGIEKYILRQSYRGFLPSSILERKKQGFNLPLKHWLADELNPLLHEYLSVKKIRENGFFQEETVRELIGRFEDGGEPSERLLYLLLVFQMWWESL